MVRFDFGRSLIDQRPVLDKLAEALPRTALVAGLALLLGFGLAVLAAIAAVALRFRSSIVGVTIDRVVARLHPIVTAAIVALALAAPTARWFENRQADRDLASTWLWVKLAAVVGLLALHGVYVVAQRRLAAGAGSARGAARRRLVGAGAAAALHWPAPSSSASRAIR